MNHNRELKTTHTVNNPENKIWSYGVKNEASILSQSKGKYKIKKYVKMNCENDDISTEVCLGPWFMKYSP